MKTYQPPNPLPAFLMFASLYMLDAYLSIRFIVNDITNEGNPFIRNLIHYTGTVNSLYVIKIAVLLFAFFVLRAAYRKGINLIPLYLILSIIMVGVNFVSLQMVG